MGQLTGIITAGLQLGLESILVKPTRNLGPFEAQVWISEDHSDELEITDHPVETGARITDHAFMRPSEVVIKCGWSNSPSGAAADGGLLGLAGGIVSGLATTVTGLASLLSGNDESGVRAVYQNLLILQASRIPFDILTGKRAYDNMLIKSLRVTTDADTENSLIITAVCRQVIIVKTTVQAIGAPPESQKAPESTAPTVDQGSKSLDPAPDASKTDAQKSINPVDGPAFPDAQGTTFKTSTPGPTTEGPKEAGVIPTGSTMDPQTGNIYGADGKVDRPATQAYYDAGFKQ